MAWLDKRGLAEHLACSVRSIDTAIAEGMPHAIIFGRVKFQVPEVEAWLVESGHLQRRGNAADILNQPLNGPSARERLGPGHGEASPHVSEEA